MRGEGWARKHMSDAVVVEAGNAVVVGMAVLSKLLPALLHGRNGR